MVKLNISSDQQKLNFIKEEIRAKVVGIINLK
jgi:hypothetical protein